MPLWPIMRLERHESGWAQFTWGFCARFLGQAACGAIRGAPARATGGPVGYWFGLGGEVKN